MHFKRIGGRVAVGVALVGALAACDQDKLLTAPTPDIVLPSDLSGVSTLPNAFNAVVADFQVAYAGSGASEGQVNMSGLLADELYNAETFPTRIEVDQRRTNPINNTMLAIFQNAQRARATAVLVGERFAELDSLNPQRADVLTLGAYTYILFGENYCNGVPTSRLTEAGTFDYGDPQTNVQLFTAAVARADTAANLAQKIGASANNQQYLARIAKARAQLDLGQFDQAAATVGASGTGATAFVAVPTTFRYDIQHSENTARQNNGVFSFMFASKRFGVSDVEGTNGLPYRASNDPRVAAFRQLNANGTPGFGFNAIIPAFATAKYQERKSPTPLALGTEARLIEAEAAMRRGDDITFLAKLNEARAAAQTYAPGIGTQAPAAPAPLTIADLGTSAASRQDLLFRERAFNLYLTSHRLGDMRRLIRQYGRNAETVFPTGTYLQSGVTAAGGTYGPDVNLPVPFEEQNNPKYKACIDRAA